MVGDLAENLSGMRVIQAFAQEDASQERFEQINRENRDANISAMSLSFVFLPTVEFLGMLATGIVLWFGGSCRRTGRSDPGRRGRVPGLRHPLLRADPGAEPALHHDAGGHGRRRARAGGARHRAGDRRPARRGRHAADRGPHRVRSASASPIGTASRCCTTSASTSQPGQTVALVGPTGAGKTSIANLIARFYDVTTGAVRIDGIDVRDVRQRSLRSQMGLVPQDPFLFPGTIADNIAFGRPDAPLEAIEAAARAGLAHDFIAGAARRLRHPDPGRRRQPVDGPAPAHLHRARGAGRSAHPDPGRSHRQRRHRHRGATSRTPSTGCWPDGRRSSSPTG